MEIEEEVQKDVVDYRKKEADSTTFVDGCEGVIRSMMDTELSSTLGVAKSRTFPEEQERKAHFKNLYADSVQRISMERAKTDQDKVKMLEKRNEVEKKLDSSDPAQMIKQVLKKLGGAKSKETMDVDEDELNIDEECKQLEEPG